MILVFLVNLAYAFHHVTRVFVLCRGILIVIYHVGSDRVIWIDDREIDFYAYDLDFSIFFSYDHNFYHEIFDDHVILIVVSDHFFCHDRLNLDCISAFLVQLLRVLFLQFLPIFRLLYVFSFELFVFLYLILLFVGLRLLSCHRMKL